MRVAAYIADTDPKDLRRRFGEKVEGTVLFHEAQDLYEVTLDLPNWGIWKMVVSALEVQTINLFEGRTPTEKALLLAAMRNVYQ